MLTFEHLSFVGGHSDETASVVTIREETHNSTSSMNSPRAIDDSVLDLAAPSPMSATSEFSMAADETGSVSTGATSTCFCNEEGCRNDHGEQSPPPLLQVECEYPLPWLEKNEKVVRRPYDYLNSIPGKNVRKTLLAAFNQFLDVDERSLNIITETISMLHNASLLIDDIQDGSRLRRGLPVAHNVFGIAQTINSANYVYFQAMELLFELENPLPALKVYKEELLNLHRGQGMDLYWRDTLSCPTEAEYLEMIANKTGGLFRLALRLMQSLSSVKVDLLPLADSIGLIFQIQDDYVNISSDQYMEKKGFCEDLTEGKFSFPVIHAIKHSPSSNNDILNILKLRTEDNELKAYAVRYIREAGSLEHTKKVLDELHARAGKQLHDLGGNVMISKLLEKLVVQ